MKKNLPLYFFSFYLLSFGLPCLSQNDSIRAKSIQRLTRAIRQTYFDRTVAHQMADTIDHRFKAGAYDSAYNNDEFFYLITKDLRNICKDDHIIVQSPWISYHDYSKDSWHNMSRRKRLKLWKKLEVQRKFLLAELRKEAISLGEIKILNNHTGYLQVLDFYYDPKKYKKYTMTKASSFLGKTDNLIIDLRKNGGGFVRQMVYFISYFTAVKKSYLFLDSHASRYDSSGIEKVYAFDRKIYTDPVINKSFFQPNIFVLVDGHTFSAAEGAAYLLKKVNPRVTVIGERTPGGFGTGSGAGEYEFFDARIPSGQLTDEDRNIVINEGGFEPDILVPGDSAYAVALRLANHAQPVNEKEIKYLRKMPLEKQVMVAPFELDRYTGNFLKATVEKKEGGLILNYDRWAPLKLHPVETDVFTVPLLIREVRFFRTGEGVITGIRLEFSDTFKEIFLKRPVFKPESVLGHNERE